MDIAVRIEHSIHAWALKHGIPESLHMTDASVSRRGDAQQASLRAASLLLKKRNGPARKYHYLSNTVD